MKSRERWESKMTSFQITKLHLLKHTASFFYPSIGNHLTLQTISKSRLRRKGLSRLINLLILFVACLTKFQIQNKIQLTHKLKELGSTSLRCIISAADLVVFYKSQLKIN